MNRIIKVLAPLEKSIYWFLVFLLPTQLSYHFWPDSSFVFGIRVDYLSPTIYLTDILVCFLLFVSYPKFKPWIDRCLKTNHPRSKFVKLTIITIAFIFINTFWAKEPLVAIFKWIKIFEIVLLGIYVYINKRFYKTTLNALYYSIIFFGLLGIAQFLLQGTVGKIFYLFGERSFSVSTPGVALAFLRGRDYLRAYSTFPHPNAFAGFLGVGSLLVMILNSRLRIIENKKLLPFVLVASLVFILTFSLGAIISGGATLFCYIVLRNKRHTVLKMVRYIFYIIIILSVLTIVLQKQIKNNLVLSESSALRIQQAGVAGKMFIKRPLFGVGVNNFIPSIGENMVLGTSLFLQPVHNIYLLLLTETGLVGFTMFMYLFMKLIKGKTNVIYLLPIVFILSTGFFDHYWFTLQQNQLLIPFVLGIFLNRDKQLRIKNLQFSRKSSNSLFTALLHPRIENSRLSQSLNKR